MAKIGRNDLCTCGSGKKYKHCCLNGKSKASRTISLSPDMNISTYPEEEVLGQLIETSEVFRNYYTSENENFGHITWVKSDKHAESFFGFKKGQKGKMSLLKNKSKISKYIILEQIPPELDDEFLIAHEMGHILILNKGIRGIAPYLPKDITNDERTARIGLAAAMTNIVHDPLCNSIPCVIG